MSLRIDAAAGRVSAFLIRWSEMAGTDPDGIYELDGGDYSLLTQDLRTLLAEAARKDRLQDRVDALEADLGELRRAAFRVTTTADTHTVGEVEHGVHDPALNVDIRNLYRVLMKGESADV